MDGILAFCVVLLILYAGDVVSTKTKAFVPSVFTTAILFLVGFWTVLPENIIDMASMGNPFATLCIYLLITHMGTMLSMRELAAQWKTVTIALMGLVGMCIGTLTLGRLIFGWEAAVVATPPLTGGIVAALMMQEAAAAKGLTELAVLAILVYVMQGFAGYPLTAIALRKEGTRLLEEFRSGRAKVNNPIPDESDAENKSSSFRIIPPVPENYRTTYYYLATLGLTALAAVWFAMVTNEVVSRFVICLIFGAISAELGFVERRPLNLSGSFGFLMTVLMAFVFAGLSGATPDMLIKLMVPMVGIIAIGVTGLAIFSMVVGKFLGYSKDMAFAVSLTALYGFPPNYVLTDEASKALAETPEEREYLMNEMLPKMLVGGFTTVTIASVIIAGIFVNFL